MQTSKVSPFNEGGDGDGAVAAEPVEPADGAAMAKYPTVDGAVVEEEGAPKKKKAARVSSGGWRWVAVGSGGY